MAKQVIVRCVNICKLFFILIISISFKQSTAQVKDGWITYFPSENYNNGKYIVLICGDQEYRSEEALPLLARILSTENGFKTTVLFPINPETGYVDPSVHNNILGLDHLEKADLVIIFTRWLDLPKSQMRYIAEYLEKGKPVIGLRTATHAFRYPENSSSLFAKFGYDSKKKGWVNGFGKRVLGETWISHHGINYKQGTIGLINGALKLEGSPILRGVKNIWVKSGTYTSKSDVGQVLVWGMPTDGMERTSMIDRSNTMMPVAWIRYYTSDEGNKGKVFATTMGAAVDLKDVNLRRLIVNACYWALDMSSMIPKSGASVKLLRDYNPNMFGIGNYKKKLFPLDYK